MLSIPLIPMNGGTIQTRPEPRNTGFLSEPLSPSEDYGHVDITFYVRKNPPDAPSTFYRFTNVPELKRKYWAFEFLFNKRMADGWQFSGSIIYSKAYGNIGGWYGERWGWSGAADSPNYLVNRYGRISIDRPLQIKLMGTAQLPYRIFLSAYYSFFSGSPWTRSASIRPPLSWTGPHNAYRTTYSVLLETQGSRRNRSWNNHDSRLEKEFRIGDFGRLGAYIDILNVLGWSGVNVGINDVSRWEPQAEGFNQPGKLTLSSSYKVVSSVSGTRTIKFSIRFSF